MKAQVDEQKKKIQWLMDMVTNLQSKAAAPAYQTVPWAPSQPPVAENSIVQTQAESMQPGPDGPTVGMLPASPRLAGPPFANMPDSFGIKSANGQHEVHITGQIQGDMRQYENARDTKDDSEFLLRRARLGVEGFVFDIYEFRVLPDFGNNKVVMQDCFANLHFFDWMQVMGGKFKEPVSYEEAFVQDRFVPTVERSIIDQITPARDIGFMVWGRGLFEDQVDYYLGMFNGEINADVDTNGTKDYAGRIVWRPFNYEALPDWLRPLQIGVSGTIGKEQEFLGLSAAGATTAPTSGQVLRTSGQVTWLTFAAADYANGIRTRVVPEVSYFYGPFGMCAELMRMDQDISLATFDANRPQDIRFEGYMITGTYMVTGEYHKNWGVFNPTNPFDASHPFANPGAWELVASLSRLRVDSAVFHDGFAAAAGNSDGATEMTFGFNWYLNAFVKVQFNWEHALFDQRVNLNTASGTTFRDSNALLTRLQLAF